MPVLRDTHALADDTCSNSQSLLSTATASSVTTPSASSEPLTSLRAEMMEKRLDGQQFPSSSTDSCATPSEYSLTTYSSTSASAASADAQNPDVELQLQSRLAECCRGGNRVRRWSDEDPLDNDHFVWESMGSFAAIELAEEDQKGLEEVLADAGLWSTGSSRHAGGKCRPCHYVQSNTGCENGQSCEFCHFPHTGKSRRQLSMCSRLYCKSFGDTLVAAYSGRPDQLRRTAATASTGSAYLASFLKDRMEQLPAASSAVDLPERAKPQMMDGAPVVVPSRRKNIVSL